MTIGNIIKIIMIIIEMNGRMFIGNRTMEKDQEQKQV